MRQTGAVRLRIELEVGVKVRVAHFDPQGSVAERLRLAKAEAKPDLKPAVLPFAADVRRLAERHRLPADGRRRELFVGLRIGDDRGRERRKRAGARALVTPHRNGKRRKHLVERPCLDEPGDASGLVELEGALHRDPHMRMRACACGGEDGRSERETFYEAFHGARSMSNVPLNGSGCDNFDRTVVVAMISMRMVESTVDYVVDMMTVLQVVDMVAMLDRGVAAAQPVLGRTIAMDRVLDMHHCFSPLQGSSKKCFTASTTAT
jgi:hypothetical protein